MTTFRVNLSIRVSPETNAKLKKIAKKEVRSVSNFVDYLIQKEIKRYEEEHGEIKLTDDDLYS